MTVVTMGQRLDNGDTHGDGARVFRPERLPVICFSHLPWGFVWQRPQHLLTRFARGRSVIVVEEPHFFDGFDAARLHVSHDAGVTILTPCLPARTSDVGGFNGRTNPAIRALLHDYLVRDAGVTAAITWYYTPMALGALPSSITPELVIYDAMDELANFRGAPTALHDREAALMRSADLVFTGGPSLYEARRHRHPAVHCFPSGVEAAHFAGHRGRSHAELHVLPRPIIGFYGVLDERIDFGLLEDVAANRRDWTFVMIGPMAKIDATDLADGANIHYLGQRPYHDLPSYLAGFDVAIQPFACNDATRFISPTKTLEYLAGGKPVVSTPIKDVIALYGDVVEVAASAGEFIGAIDRALTEPPEASQVRARRVQTLLAEHDWDIIAARMAHLMENALARRSAVVPLTDSAYAVASAGDVAD